MESNIKRIVVVGASAGGMQAVAELLSKVPDNLDLAIFIVLHLSKRSMANVIVQHMQKFTAMQCKVAVNEEKIKRGYVYIAPPDYHLMLKKETLFINQGPHENRWRPSIDVMFRSAAVAHGSKTVGIVLSGLMDDGTSGMSAIKRCGGVCIVQEPSEAEFSDMPVNVLNNVEVDYQVPVADIGYILADLVAKPVAGDMPVPREVQVEAELTERMASDMDQLKEISEHSVFTCPDCGGGLWEIKNDVIHRYRCHTGHVYTEKVLLEAHADVLEESIWVCIRMLEERRNLLLMIAEHEQQTTHIDDSLEQRNRAKAMEVHIARLKAMLQAIHNTE